MLITEFQKRAEQVVAQSLRPPPSLSLIEWADTYRKLSAESSSEPGRWRSNRVAVAMGPMAAVTDPETHTISVMGPTQLMKTELLNNTAGYFIHQDPGPILLIQPTLDLAKAWSKKRLAKMRRDIPELRELIADARSRDSNNTILEKEFPGGDIAIVGANSPVSLSMRPIRIVLADEIDKYPESAGTEGDPLALGEERAATFWNRKKLRVCSPTIKGKSRIEGEYLASDRRRCFVACPHCGHEAPLEWAMVKWGKGENGEHDADSAALWCGECGTEWREVERLAALAALADAPDYGWRQTAKFYCCGAHHTPSEWTPVGRSLCPSCGEKSPYDGHAGFWCNALYSPWRSVSELVRIFLKAKHSGDPEKLKTVTNTLLAETWEETGERIEVGDLIARREIYSPDALPTGIMVITAGVDVQDNRLEVEFVGWGEGHESWGVQYEVIFGDPGQDEVWRQLDECLLQRFTLADGRAARCVATAIDSGGHHADRVYDFTAKRFGRRVFAIKGEGTAGRPVWPKKASLSKTNQTLFIVGTMAAKDSIFSWVQITEPGAGYCHWPVEGYPDDYDRQMTSEEVVTRKAKGQSYRMYVKQSGRRNEALDCRVYAYAALKSLGPRALMKRAVAAPAKRLPAINPHTGRPIGAR